MTMMHRLGRFLNDLIGRAYFWIGSLLLIVPIAAYFPSRGIKRDLPGLWRTEDYIWPMFAGALLLLWAAFLEWNQQRALSLKLLRAEWARSERVGEPELELPSFPLLSLDEIAELRHRGRHLASEQRVALVTALSESVEPIHVDIVYYYLDAEAEAYAAQFAALLVPLRFAGSFVPVSDFSGGLEGVVVRVNSESIPPPALRLLNALTSAKIDHRMERLTGGRALLSPPDYFDLAIGRMKREGNQDCE